MDGEQAVIGRSELDALFDALRARGYRVVGPVVRDGAVVLDELASAEDLPAGWRDEQEGGHYRLRPGGDQDLFSFANGPQSWRRFLFPPSTRLWRATRTDDGFEVHTNADEEPRYAFVGVRACDLRAIGIQDKVFMEGPEPDPGYVARRAAAFVIAVNCGRGDRRRAGELLGTWRGLSRGRCASRGRSERSARGTAGRS